LNRVNHMTRSANKSGAQQGTLSNLDLKILWVSRTLTNIDFQYEPEFIRIKQSPVHDDIKKMMRDALISTYRRKRAPYVKLLVEMRNQQRQANRPKAG
jgi:hypothetical protein